jgi:ribosomal-protein-alanine N-acetyltransferase
MQTPNPPREMPVLQTDRLLLRGIEREDQDDVYAYASDPLVAKFTTWYEHQTIRHTIHFIELIQKQSQHPDVTHWAMVWKPSGRVIGTCDLRMALHRGEIGYALSREYWGQGIMPEALYEVLRYGFEVKRLERIEARCMVDNHASERVMQKLGMQFEGVLRKHIFARGAYQHVKMYAILKEEFMNTSNLERTINSDDSSGTEGKSI